MNHCLTRLIVVLCILFTTLGTLDAAQPRMEKAILILRQAQVAPNPILLLGRARVTLRNARANKSGFRVKAIRTIQQAITTTRQGGDAQPLISRAITEVQAGIDNVVKRPRQ